MAKITSNILLVLLFVLLSRSVSALPFDQAYMVAGPLETTPIESFAIDGPTPWLFVDLPGLGSLFTVVESSWFAASEVGARFPSVVPSQQNLEHFWLAPSEAAWAAARTTGRWTIDVRFELVGILFAENGGIGVGISEGGGLTSVSFDVVPIPEPGTALLVGVGLVGLCAARGRAEDQASA